MGFEPLAIRLKAGRSTWLSYRPMAVSGPSADRRGIQKCYALGHARGWGRFCDPRGGAAKSPVEEFSHKGWENLHQMGAECRGKYRECVVVVR